MGTLPYFIDDLNTNNSLRPLPSEAEISILDKALLVVDEDPDAAMRLCDLYLTKVLGKEVGLVLSPKVTPKRRNRKQRLVSKRKLKRQNHALIQKLYKRNRSKAFERIFKGTSVS